MTSAGDAAVLSDENVVGDERPPAPNRAEKLLAALASRPYDFEFFQAVRLLTRAARRQETDEPASGRPVGHDYPPRGEIVRFRSFQSHSFPQSEITSFAVAAPEAAREDGSPAEMTVSFLGLTGPAGALPQHYTQTIIDRLRLKDGTLRDFLDLFNHRFISLFYRAWEKHRIPPLLERARAEQREDPYTRAVYSLVGLGLAPLRNRLEVPDETFLYYAGLFAHYPKNAVTLERMLADWLGLAVAVQQFQGQWLQLEPPEQTALPDARFPNGLNCALGMVTMAGARTWSVECKFRIRLGPLGYQSFSELMPDRRQLTRIGQMVRTYVGPELDFDVQPVLRREEIPPCVLAATGVPGPRLGWNTWMISRTRAIDAEEAIFVADGRPTR